MNAMNNKNLFVRIKDNFATGIRVLKTGGLPAFKQLLIIKLHLQKYFFSNWYENWIKKNEKDILKTEKLSYSPLISVVVPVYNVDSQLLRECIESVLAQTYTNWQLCIADDASSWQSVKEVLNEYEKNPKVKIVYRKENGHISKATNSALSIAEGEYVSFMDCDDTLAPNALFEVAKKLNENPRLDFIYSDEDKINESGSKRHYPHFKAEWSPDTFMSLMYTSHLGTYRKSLVEEVGMLREGFEGAQDYDLTLRIVEKTDQIAHINKILYHWRERKESTSADASAKPYVLEAQKKAKEEALQRRNQQGSVEFVKDVVQFHVNYAPPAENPLVSIIIPSKDNYKVYKRCVESIRKRSSYKNYEIITIDNGSAPGIRRNYEDFCKKNDVKYFYKEEEFNFSQMCNRGVEKASGDFYLFLNDDTEVITGDWLERMLGQAALPHTGAVGAKLYYPGGNLLQHSGVVSRMEGPSHILCGWDDRKISDFGRNRLTYNYIAVTGACLMISGKKYHEVNGFDETFPIAYNDVELCFKLTKAGYYNVQRNDVRLYHYESLSRGDDSKDKAKLKRLIKERNRLYSEHPEFYCYDPFFSCHLMEKGL